MSDLALRAPDSPHGELVDNLVADLLDGAMRMAQVATDQVSRLDQYPELKERYGDGGLRLVAQWAGPAGRVARADIHRALRERGMSQRQIAATTGVHESTVSRDLADAKPARRDPDAEPDERLADASDEPTILRTPDPTPDLHDTAKRIDPGERGFVSLIRGVIRELEEAELVNAGSVTPGKVGVMRDLFHEAEALRDQWQPYMTPALREVKP